MQVTKKIDFEDPNILLMVRAGYLVSNLIVAGISLYITRQIENKKGVYCLVLDYLWSLKWVSSIRQLRLTLFPLVPLFLLFPV